ncbi:hypothetical protein Tsubulata_014331 [Turnera subulata]|uniref:Transcriptional coactivator Hfi1/Transcriptional adapter 1 n=1 Tax=Turnera subulata TaxID=218843 RepID=A0A9Q0FVU5_9ROSI|nr:hypothetical protein Tsubulata_014331 [Turnera subulata]
MQRAYQHSRVDVAELKAEIVKRIGGERSRLYFYYLNKLLSLKLSKIKFNKFCIRVLGRENVPLHNQFIRSILQNACNAKVSPPPPSCNNEMPSTTSDGSYPFANGKMDLVSYESMVTSDIISFEDGIQMPLQHHQVILRKEEKGKETLLPNSSKLPLVKQSIEGSVSVHSREKSSISVVEDGGRSSSTIALQAPLGIPFCTASAGGSCRQPRLAINHRSSSECDSGLLVGTQTLRERMQHIAAAQGLEGVPMESANLLNIGLDAYLRGLIKSSLELVDSRCQHDSTKGNSQKHYMHGKNGFLPGHHFHVENSSGPLNGKPNQTSNLPISLLDFKVAMELKPQQLGEDWPLLLEKICTRAFEE